MDKIKMYQRILQEYRNPRLSAGLGRALPDKRPSNWYILSKNSKYKNISDANSGQSWLEVLENEN